MELNNISPEWAWAPFEPSAAQPWNRALAAHLYRRAAFAGNTHELDEAVRVGPSEAVKKLVRGNSSNQKVPAAESDGGDSFETHMEELGQTVMAGGKSEQLGAWWLYRMNRTPDPFLEKLILFWHGHFATSAAKVEDARLMKAHEAVLRRHARGRFGELTSALAKDPAMLIWLDSQSNRKARPNENFARELMELFCLGPGHYTEVDIRQMARAFTGWEVQQGAFHFNAHQHDHGLKTFLGQSGDFNGEDAVRIVLEQPGASRFIARKITRYFVCDEPTLSDRLIEPLAVFLRQQNFTIAPLAERILTSNLFFSQVSVGRKVRGPVDLAIGFLRALDATTNHVQLNETLGRLGQALYFPPNVKGWEGGRAWLNSATYLGRANLLGQLIREAHFKKGGLAEIAREAGATSSSEIIDWLLELLVALPPTTAARAVIAETVSRKGEDRNAEIGQILHAISLLPEFQLS